MRQRRLEAMRQAQKEYHRKHPWRLSAGGLYIPHCYSDMTPESLACWDDVGFVMNGRRVMVFWEHPRYRYKEAIRKMAWEEVGNGPRDNWLFEGGTKNYRKVGRSRKKLVSYTCREPSAQQQAHYDLLNATIARLEEQGIDCNIPVSWKWKRMHWAMSVQVVAPLEVRNEDDLAELARLAKRLIRQATSLALEFPGYSYGREQWLNERALLQSSVDG